MRIKNVSAVTDSTMYFRILIQAVLATFFFTAAMASGATIYTWTDENGVRHMTNIAPVAPEEDMEVMEIEPPPVIGEPEILYTKPEDLSARSTDVNIIDNHVIVPVTLQYKRKKIKARLLLDTGSTTITLHKKTANRLSIKKPQKGAIRVAGGDVIDAEAVVLDSVTVGPHTKRNLVAGIIEHKGPDVPFDGLLGMNFLKSYRYTIDFRKKVLRWNK